MSNLDLIKCKTIIINDIPLEWSQNHEVTYLCFHLFIDRCLFQIKISVMAYVLCIDNDELVNAPILVRVIW